MDMDNLSEGLKKVMLAGIGAMALTAEKSQKFIEDMVEKGEITANGDVGPIIDYHLHGTPLAASA